VHEHARPLDMAQERVTEAGPGTGALDEARQVSERGAPLVTWVIGREVQDPRFGSSVVNG